MKQELMASMVREETTEAALRRRGMRPDMPYPSGGMTMQKYGLAMIDGEPRLVPQAGEMLKVPTSAGRVHNGTDECRVVPMGRPGEGGAAT